MTKLFSLHNLPYPLEVCFLVLEWRRWSDDVTAGYTQTPPASVHRPRDTQSSQGTQSVPKSVLGRHLCRLLSQLHRTNWILMRTFFQVCFPFVYLLIFLSYNCFFAINAPIWIYIWKRTLICAKLHGATCKKRALLKWTSPSWKKESFTKKGKKESL